MLSHRIAGNANQELFKHGEKKEVNKAMTPAKIKVGKNGPYLVSGGVSVSKQTIISDPEGTAWKWREDIKYKRQEKCGLCRCGHSKNKPYCDGTHLKIGFDGTETAGAEVYLKKPKEIDGPVLKLFDIEELCASARFCHRATGIWNLVPKSEKAEIRKTIIEEIFDCPSGRLIILDKKSGKNIEAETEESIVAIEDPWAGVSGPLRVQGGIPIESADGKIYRIRNRVTLCRCGKSKNKPFCDSSHYPEEHEHGGNEK
jgi:CDGSH-type Zn-finger protein